MEAANWHTQPTTQHFNLSASLLLLEKEIMHDLFSPINLQRQRICKLLFPTFANFSSLLSSSLRSKLNANNVFTIHLIVLFCLICDVSECAIWIEGSTFCWTNKSLTPILSEVWICEKLSISRVAAWVILPRESHVASAGQQAWVCTWPCVGASTETDRRERERERERESQTRMYQVLLCAVCYTVKSFRHATWTLICTGWSVTS